MRIELKQLKLQYFKGAKDLTVPFSHRTEIRGKNESGKTRLVDAWSWLLFGKNSEDQKEFSIKALDKNNQPLHRVDHSVTGVLSIDGNEMKFERIYKEKWVKKRGEETAEFNGHETLFFVNGVPHQLKDYTEKVESILPESLFKQVTNPGFFNSMKWTDRRAMLFEMAGKITDKDVIATSKELKKFYESLSGKDFEEFKKELAAKKKLLKESILNIPARIDEVNRAIVSDPDYAQINSDINKHNIRLNEIDRLLASDAEKFNKANQENERKQSRIYELRRQINELYFLDKSKVENANQELKIKKTGLTNKIASLKSDIEGFNSRINLLKKQKTDIEDENNSLRKQWTDINESSLTFNENEFICPACGRQLEGNIIEDKKAQIRANFNGFKSAKLKKITDMGRTNAAEIERINQDITKLALQISGYSVTIDKYQKELDAIVIPEVFPIDKNPQIKILQDEINITEGLIKSIAKTDNSTLTKEKAEINNALDALKIALNVKTENEKHKKRLQELIDSEKSLAQQIADLEKQEFQCEAFTRAKIEMIEDKVNSMFSLVRFKMFNGLINGGQEEVCEALINGVPYTDANAAAKIQAGLDIIRTLSKHYDCYAPVFIDNRESVTEIPEMDCQVISLYVDPEYKELKIVNN
jgi:DNA repair exonuclease SbcCD ATPase subunit